MFVYVCMYVCMHVRMYVRMYCYVFIFVSVHGIEQCIITLQYAYVHAVDCVRIYLSAFIISYHLYLIFVYLLCLFHDKYYKS